MNTPREILNRRHEPALRQLDAIRASVVAQIENEQKRSPWWIALWAEIFVTGRHTWWAIGFAWVVILVLQFRQDDGAGSVRTRSMYEPASAYVEQRELLRAELGGVPAPSHRSPAPPSAPSGRFAHPPRRFDQSEQV